MEMKLVETSLNLRIESGKQKEDYSLSKAIADKQLSLSGDVYANVEFMDCDHAEYLQAFATAGYHEYTSLDHSGRGILCEVKDGYDVKKLGELSEPHMLHLRITKAKQSVDLIIIRLLVAGGSEEDFKDRHKQWQTLLKYMDDHLPEKSHLVLTGDYNHGVIGSNIREYCGKPRQYFNYQMIVNDLERKNITLHPIDGFSYRGYLKIDHLATGQNIAVTSAAYEDVFHNEQGQIGIPDHSLIVANIQCT